MRRLHFFEEPKGVRIASQCIKIVEQPHGLDHILSVVRCKQQGVDRMKDERDESRFVRIEDIEINRSVQERDCVNLAVTEASIGQLRVHRAFPQSRPRYAPRYSVTPENAGPFVARRLRYRAQSCRRSFLHTNDNLTTERKTFVTHLECSATGERYAADEIHNLSRVGKPLLVRYDLDGVKRALSKDELAKRPPDLWRYRELPPVRRKENIVSLGETMTPLVPLPKLAAKLGVGEILIKDEGRLPTGSFKARGLVMAVSMAKALGIAHMAMPTNGNAGAALAAYATRCGIRTTIFCPADTPEVNVSEIELQGATVYRVNGLIDDCGKIVGEGKAKAGWFDTSTLKEPYRIEGKKTMGLELAEQLGWDVPDVIFYPTGGGTGLIGMWKAFSELEAIGFIGAKRPRMVAVQAAGCAPMVRAFENGTEHAPRWEDAHTIASGIRVPQAVGDFLILRVVRESKGFAIAVTDEAISAALNEVAREEGLLLCPEGAATYAAYQQSLADGRVSKSDRVMLFNCATGLKYPLPPVTRTLDRHQPIDYAKL